MDTDSLEKLYGERGSKKNDYTPRIPKHPPWDMALFLSYRYGDRLRWLLYYAHVPRFERIETLHNYRPHADKHFKSLGMTKGYYFHQFKSPRTEGRTLFNIEAMQENNRRR